MSGDSRDPVIYSRQKRSQGTKVFREPSAKEEVESLLSSLETNCGGCKLEVLTIERIQKEKWQSSFQNRKHKFQERAQEREHWKYEELDPLKKQMRNKLLGTEPVLDKRVFVGVDSDKSVEGIAKTGFASTKCRNNWFGFGHYVTTHAWYAARYGLDGCYDNKGGILDPHSEIAEGKQGRLLVCRAVMSNVYPITRSCQDDHAIKDFATAAKQGKLWSEWFNESSKKPRAMNPGYDAHFVRVKKKDAGDYSNFLACPDDDVLKLSDEIADELVLPEEEQLLPEYFVHFCVRKLADGTVLNSETLSGSHHVSLNVYSSPTGSSTNLSDFSRRSTQKGADSPPNVDVLLVFTEKKEWSYMMGKRQELHDNGLEAHFSDKISSFADLNKAAKVKNPFIVYIEGSPNGFDWRRGFPGAELIEEFVKNLGNTPIPGRKWTHWRGCIMNLCTTKPDVAESLCGEHPGKLSLLSWVSRPDEEDMNELWKRFFVALEPEGLIEDKQNAFKEACLETLEYISCDKLHMAPNQQSEPALDNPKAFAASVSDALKGRLEDLEKQPSTQQPKAAALELEVSEAEKAAIDAKLAKFLEQESEAEGRDKVPMAAENSVPFPKASLAEAKATKKKLRLVKAAVKGPSKLVGKMAGLLKSPLPNVRTKEVSIEAHIDTQPPVPNYQVEESTVEEICEFEQSIDKVTGGKCIVTGTGSFYVKMGIEAFEWLCRRVHGNDTPLHVKLPKAWACGVGEARVSKVLPGRMCWLKAIMQAQDVHRLCNHLSVQLEEMKTEVAALGKNLSTQQGHGSSSTVLRSRSRSIVLPGRSRNMEESADESDYHLGNLRLGDPVRVFSHSIRQWCDGEIVRLLDENCIYVEYQVDYQDWHGKKMHVHSDDLITPTSGGASQQEPFGEQVFEVRIATFAGEVLLDVSGVELLGEFKERVANKLGWMSEQMKLFHSGIHLHNESQRLFEYGLSPANNELQAVQAALDATKPRFFNNKLDEQMVVEIASSRQPFLLQTHDIAGQMEYHVMFHRFFMSNNGISAIVFSLYALDKDPNTSERHISFWISSVLEHAPASRVVIIATHKDSFPAKPALYRVLQKATSLLEDMMQRFDIAPLLVRNDKEDKLFFPVDNSRIMENHGIDILRTSIENECRKLLTPPNGLLSRPLPLRWLKLQDWLEQRAGTQDGWYIKKDELYAQAKGSEYSFEDTKECDLFLDYLVRAGAAFYFQSAEDCIVVNPNQMVCALANMIAFREEKLPKDMFKQVQTGKDWQKLKEKGLLTSSLAKVILKSETEQNQNLVLKVLKESGVMVSHGTNEWYLPSVMPFIQDCFGKSMEPPPCEGIDIVVLTDAKYPSAAPTLLVQLLCRAVADPFNGKLELFNDYAVLWLPDAPDCQWKVELLRTQKSSIRWSLGSGKQVLGTPMMYKALEVLQNLIHEFDERVVSTGPPCPAGRCTGLHMHSIDFSKLYGCVGQSFKGSCGECIDCGSMPDWVQTRVQQYRLHKQQGRSYHQEEASSSKDKVSSKEKVQQTEDQLSSGQKLDPAQHEANTATIMEKLLQTQEKQDIFDRALEAGESNISTLKMILLGEGRSGKTSTWKALVGRDFDPNEDSTHGLNAERVTTRHLQGWDVKKRGEVAGVYEMGIHHSAAKVLLGQANHDSKARVHQSAISEAEYSLRQLSQAACSERQMRELRKAGYSLEQFMEAGCTPEQLKWAAFEAYELKQAGYCPSQLKAAGFSASQLKAAGFSLRFYEALDEATMRRRLEATMALDEATMRRRLEEVGGHDGPVLGLG